METISKKDAILAVLKDGCTDVREICEQVYHQHQIVVTEAYCRSVLSLWRRSKGIRLRKKSRKRAAQKAWETRRQRQAVSNGTTLAEATRQVLAVARLIQVCGDYDKARDALDVYNMQLMNP